MAWLDPEDWSPERVDELAGPVGEVLERLDPGFQIPISASRTVALTTPLVSLASSGATMRTASSIASSAVPIRVAIRRGLGRGELAGVRVGDRLVRHLAIRSVCFSIFLMIGLTRSLSASMSALSRSYAGLVLFGTPSASELSSEPVSL